MDIILKQDVELLGSKFDVVTVKDGYARNFLIPQGMAVAATTSNLKVNLICRPMRTALAELAGTTNAKLAHTANAELAAQQT